MSSINLYSKEQVDSIANTKQNQLVSGSNIRTINGTSLLGSGNITISGSGSLDKTVTHGGSYGTAALDAFINSVQYGDAVCVVAGPSSSSSVAEHITVHGFVNNKTSNKVTIYGVGIYFDGQGGSQSLGNEIYVENSATHGSVYGNDISGTQVEVTVYDSSTNLKFSVERITLQN